MNNDTIFLTCPKCHKTKAFSYYYEIAYVCNCGYSYEGDVLNRLKSKSLRYIPKESDKEEADDVQNYGWTNSKTNFCSNCGADMRGDEE